MLIDELGAAVKARRLDMGLTQASVARLSGLSRSTVNALENGTIKDLSVTRAEKLLDSLGLTLAVPQVHRPSRTSARRRSPALEVAARTANVSYRPVLTSAALRKSLMSAKTTPSVFANVRALLEEAPVAMLARVVEQLHDEAGVDRTVVWQNMRTLAREMQVNRDILQ
jgi:transcriptional regulator with XRE-family HTH domain